MVVAASGDAQAGLADLEPVTRFIAAVCQADATFQAMTRSERSQVPGKAARGMLIIAEAVAALGGRGTVADVPAPLGSWPPGYETKDPNVTVARPPGAGM